MSRRRTAWRAGRTLEAAFDAASTYVLTPEAVSHDDVFGVLTGRNGGFFRRRGNRRGRRVRDSGKKNVRDGFCSAAGLGTIGDFRHLGNMGRIDFEGLFAVFHSLFFAGHMDFQLGFAAHLPCTRLDRHFGWAWALFGSWSRLRAALFARPPSRGNLCANGTTLPSALEPIWKETTSYASRTPTPNARPKRTSRSS